MDKSSLVKQYLDWSSRNTEKLFRYSRLPKPVNVVPVLEWPAFPDQSESEKFIVSALAGGYKAVNFSLFKLAQKKYTAGHMSAIAGKLSHGSAHGSSIKRQIKTGISYKKFLEEDLLLISELDPERNLVINYDLFAGQPTDFVIDENFQVCREKNMHGLANALGIKNTKQNLEYSIVERIISDVAEVFKDSGYRIVFEIPGSKGWSMLPEINVNNLSFITERINLYFPEAGLCIDVGHALTWSQDPLVLGNYIDILTPYKGLIKMLHISSAGSWSPEFISLYKAAYDGIDVPEWHIKALDITLAICESEQLNFIQKLRQLCEDRLVLEVSENRTPTDSMNDYFLSCNLGQIDNRSYFENIIKQGAMLGYV